LWRLAIIDSAVSSLDIQTYLWYPDASGKLIFERAILAAQRGVRVRLIIDDLLTAGQDQLMADLQQHPNIELRLFNPWSNRRLGGRAGQMIAQMERLNTRMHNKMMVVDGQAAIIGGRNIGDHYFGLNDKFNFHDLDIISFGYLARQAAAMFDEFWNSEWVVSAENLTTAPDPETAAESWRRLQSDNRSAEELAGFPREPKNWADELASLAGELDVGTSEIVYDSVSDDEIAQTMLSDMAFLFQRARRELLITNAYIIPSQRGIDLLADITGAGVEVRILTNSLESHDVPAVNSHYQRWRDDLVSSGAQLFELRADASLQSRVDVPPVHGEFVGLHTKAAVIDRRQVFVGSMNLDPRSANTNTEMGIIVTSPGLGEKLAELMLRDMNRENAWQVMLDEDGDPYWVNSERTVDRQPSRGPTQRVMNTIFRVVPKGQF
jgi:putative cardiolipin synthase